MIEHLYECYSDNAVQKKNDSFDKNDEKQH